MAADVGERFLHDPVGGLVHVRWEHPLGAGDGDGDREAGGPRAGDQPVELAEIAAVAVLGAAQHAERGAQLPGGVRARLLDRQQRRRHLVAALAGQVHRHPGLNADDGDAVRQRVVQLAGDPQPLLLGAALRLLLACPLGQLEPLEQQLNVRAAVP